jgi:hypothetical protein
MARTLTDYILEKASQKRDDAKKSDSKKSKKDKKSQSGTLVEFLLDRKNTSKSSKTGKSNKKGETLTEYIVSKITDKKKKEETKKQQSQTSFVESLNQSFRMLSRKTEEMKSLVSQQRKLLEQQSEEENLLAVNVSILEDLFAHRAKLEKQVFLSVAHRFSDFPEDIPEPSNNENDDEPEESDDSSNDNDSSSSAPDKPDSPPPSTPSAPPTSPDKKAEGGITPAQPTQKQSKKSKTQSLVPYADVMQLGMQASGMAAINTVAELMKKSGALGGFFVPYIKSLVTPFGVAMGIGESVISSLLGGSARAATLEMNAAQKDFGKTWRSFLGDENFIAKFIDRTTTGVMDQLDNVVPQELTGDLAQKSLQFAKYLMSKHGLKDFQAAAIVGVMLREGFGSGKPDVREGGQRGAPTYDGTSQMGYGWIQWTNTQGGGPNDRLNRVLIHLGMGPPPKKTRPWTDMDNIKAMEYEWQNHYTKTIPAVKGTSNITDAVYEFVGNYTAGSHANISTYQNREDKSGGGFIGRRNSSAAGVLKLFQSGDTKNAKLFERGGLEGNKSSLLNSYIVDGPESGFSANIQGLPVTLHGKEIVRVFDGGFEVYPLENREYSIKEDPMGVMQRWSEIASGLDAKISSYFAAGGVSEGVKAIKHDEALSSLSRGRNDYIVNRGPSVISSVPWSKVSASTPLYAYETGVSGDRTTIGWGMTYYDSITAGRKAVKPGDVITKAKADSLLMGLVNNYVNTLKGQKWYQKYWNKMSAKQQGGLLAYGYNQPAHLLGTGAPKMYAALNRGDMNAVAANIDRGLPAREKNEKALVLSGPRNLNTATSSKPDRQVVVNRVGGGTSQPRVSTSSRRANTSSPSFSFDPLRFIRELTMQRTR